MAILLALAACALSSIACIALLQARSQLVSGADVLLAHLEALCTPGVPALLLPIQQSLHMQGKASLTDKLTIPVKDSVTLLSDLTVLFKGNIPINTNIRMQLFRGGPAVEVPINTVVPIATQVTLPQSVTIPIDVRASVPTGFAIPMEADVVIHQDVPLEMCPPEGQMRQVIESIIRQVRAARELVSPSGLWQHVLRRSTD